MKKLAQFVHGALLIAALLAIAALAGGVIYRWHRGQYMVKTGDALPALQGYRVNYTAGPFAATGNCIVYRLVSRQCGFCGREEPLWQRLMADSAVKKCQFVILLPGLKASPFPTKATAVPQVVWVPLDWAHSVHLLMTPTTLVTKAGRITWVEEGALDAASYASLRAQLARISGD